MTREALLREGLRRLGIDPGDGACDTLLRYVDLLAKWNRVYNLTAIRDPQQMLVQHLLDSLSVLPVLPAMTTLADVGTGGGLPGIPVAIMRPAMQVSLIETSSKKASFLQQARIELGLTRVEVCSARVENLVERQFEGIISRAFAELALFVDLCGKHLAPGGRLYAMKGVYPQSEVAALPPGWEVESSHALDVPFLEAERHLLIIRKA